MKKHFLGKLFCLIMAIAMVVGIVGCANNSGSNEPGNKPGGQDDTLTTDATPTIYLAGDSTVQTYDDEQYIAGWGQYLNYFLDENVTVVNAARGGRSSRSFINEGRLFEGEEYAYTFSENGGKSIEETIQAGDFLFVQFGHNDDATKDGTWKADRMVPLGEPDADGIFPVTAPTNGADGRDDGKNVTTYIPSECTGANAASDSTKNDIKKYGDYYYAYDCGGTYKWFLKQYVDLAREKGATPVLVTPVSRVKYNGDGTQIVGAAGSHGPNFEYVQAVRQLAEEENCLLIDLFVETKAMLETATKTYGDFLMAIVPNTAKGTWPTDYDNMYTNKSDNFEKMEATHYNKYGAYLSAAMVAENILKSVENSDVRGEDGSEYFNFTDHVKTTPSAYVDPSNLISKTKVAALEGLFEKIKPTNPNRTYPAPAEVVTAINTLTATEVTKDNYETQLAAYQATVKVYENLNVDDRASVTNYDKLQGYGASLLNAKILVELDVEASAITTDNFKTYEPKCKALRAEYEALSEALQEKVTNLSHLTAIEAAIKSAKPKPTKVVVFNPENVSSAEIGTSKTIDGITFTFNTLTLDTQYVSKTGFEYNDNEYAATSKSILFDGNFNNGTTKCIEFTTDKAFTITVAVGSSGDERPARMVGGGASHDFTAGYKGETKVTTVEGVAAGTYKLGSAGSKVYLYYIIIEFYS